MSTSDKKDYTPAENVAADKGAAAEATSTRAQAKTAASGKSFTLSKGAIIGLSAAGVAVVLGAGFGGAAIAGAADHNGRDGGREHSQMQNDGQMGGRGDGDNDGGRGRMGQDGQMGPQGQNGQMGPQGQLPGGQLPGGTAPDGTTVPNTGQAPAVPQSAPQGAPQALGSTGIQAPHGFSRAS